MKRPALRRLPVLLAVVLLGSGCAAFSDDGAGGATASDREAGDPIRVATAFYPLQFVTERVAGDLAEVQNLTSPGQEPHDLELTVQQTAAVTEADLVVVEADLQPGVADVAEQNARGAVLEVADVVELEEADHGGHDHGAEEHAGEGGEAHSEEEHAEEEHGEEGHDHGGVDPHFWQDPQRMADLATAVAERLGEIAPEQAETFDANAEALVADLDALDAAYAEGLGGCARQDVVVSHDAFGYLTRYGLEFHPIAGLSPDAEPTPADLAELQDLIAEDGVTTVFGETLVSPRLSETLAQDAGVGTAVLDPIEGLTDDTADQDYLSLMEQNLSALEEANGCA